MNCKYCGKKKNHGKRPICQACFDANVDGCKTEYNRRYRPGQKANVPCIYECGRKPRNHATGICVECARSARRKNGIPMPLTFAQMRKQHEYRWTHNGIVYTAEDLDRHLSVTECDFCGRSLEVYRAMDHDHDTNEYRGTLCRKCNCGLGQLGDNLEDIITRTQAYKDRKR